jgi:uncharacterized phage protein (predicted DNA packaging)
MAILDDIKKAMRISTSVTAYDTEITDLINAAKSDLELSGVVYGSTINIDSDPLFKRAIITYCKANFGYNNPDADRLQKAYDLLKHHLTLTIEYSKYTVTFSITDADTSDPIDDATITFNGETKITDIYGQAIFYVRAENSLKYSVSAENYQSYPTSSEDDDNIDITDNTTVELTLTAIGA